MTKMNVESFNLDHTKVDAPFVRLAGIKEGLNGDVIHKYDIRFKQPNKEHMEMPALHSLEHLMAENIRNHHDRVVDLSPMGCQTGFYAITYNMEQDELLMALENGLNDILTATEVPAANERQCGWGESHSLEGAQAAARAFLAKKDEWLEVMA